MGAGELAVWHGMALDSLETGMLLGACAGAVAWELVRRLGTLLVECLDGRDRVPSPATRSRLRAKLDAWDAADAKVAQVVQEEAFSGLVEPAALELPLSALVDHRERGQDVPPARVRPDRAAR